MCNMCIREASTLEPEVAFPKEKMERSHIERMKSKHNIVTDPDDEVKQKEVAYQPDLLAVSTQYTKAAYDLIKEGYLRFQDSKVHTILTRTTQPFHLLLGLVTLVAWGASHSGGASLRAWRAVYVGTVAVHLGAQVWMTLISGIVLYFSLPRHEFGRVQTILFPVYYMFNASTSLLALLAYFRTQCLTDFQHTSYVQFALLLSVFSIEAFVRLRLVQPMLRAKHMKTQMEEAAGGGQEVGRLILGELAHCPRYMSILRAFRRYHSAIAMGTMITFGCSLYSTMIIVDSICR